VIVVIDTNVWISALHFSKPQGTPSRALERAIARDVIGICAEMEEEILRVLIGRCRWLPTEARNKIDAVLERSLRVEIDGVVMGCRDPKDDMVLECAMLARADLIVAGDKDLLVMRESHGARIVTPAEYLTV
jgi:putative PIN family toxin of toxin-antitoxin system